MDGCRNPRSRNLRSRWRGSPATVDPRMQEVESTTTGADPLDELRFIRQSMESAGSFTAVPGWGTVLVGLTALVASAWCWEQNMPFGVQWMTVWLFEALVAVAIAGTAILFKSRRIHAPLSTVPARRFALTFSAPMLAGALLTFMLYRAGVPAALPGTWLVLYGTALLTGGVLSVKLVRNMGACFVALGALALIGPVAWGNAFMAMGFGGFHILFGWLIARKHGG